ncbi:unnamed protein product [Closterium sp. NIES-54]
MKQAEWVLSKATHAFRRSGVQGISDDGCSDNDIGSLGSWAQGEVRRSYIVGVPFGPVFLQAGYSGDRGDYYIGRSKAKLPRHKDPKKDDWKMLLNLFDQHIFPWVEADLKKVHAWNAKQKDVQKRHYAVVRFLETLKVIGRLVVAQDLAMMWINCEVHRNKEEGFRRCKCERHLEECGKVQGAYAQVMSQNQELKAVLASRDLAYAKLLAEFEALKCSGGASSHGVNASADGGGSSMVSNGGAAGQSLATPQAVSAVEAFFFKHVVVEWRDAKTVAAAWALWVKKAHIMNG